MDGNKVSFLIAADSTKPFLGAEVKIYQPYLSSYNHLQLFNHVFPTGFKTALKYHCRGEGRDPKTDKERRLQLSLAGLVYDTGE